MARGHTPSRSWRYHARLLAALLTSTVVVAACQAADGPVADDGELAAGDVAAGRELYQANCASCHGADLRGTSNGPPHLHPVYEPGHHGDAAFQLAVARGVPQHHWDFGPMPPIEGLSEQDVTDIIAYVREQQRAAGIE